MENTYDALLTDDQHFLLYIVMGAYFAPDLKEERPYKSALQRMAEGLPQYHAKELAGSSIKTTVIENIYCYILRKAEQTVVVKQPLLLQYIHGSIAIPLEGAATYLQFNDLFPPKLHRRSQCEENQHGIIDNVVFINNPETYYLKRRDIERFKRLTGLESFNLDREVMMHITGDDGTALYGTEMQETSRFDGTMQHLNIQHLDYAQFPEAYLGGNEPSNSSMPFSFSQCEKSPVTNSSIVPSQLTTSCGEDINQGVIFLPSCPSKEEWSNLVATINSGFALTGSAAKGHLGPVLGLMDIGESEDSYLFRVSLPGVRRDERDFSCEVESDGRVIIKGVTVTGERTVEKYSQVFEMQSQNLCPPGPFSISFKLPGPVDPRQFHGTFATDGILEGLALKARRYAR